MTAWLRSFRPSISWKHRDTKPQHTSYYRITRVLSDWRRMATNLWARDPDILTFGISLLPIRSRRVMSQSSTAQQTRWRETICPRPSRDPNSRDFVRPS